LLRAQYAVSQKNITAFIYKPLEDKMPPCPHPGPSHCVCSQREREFSPLQKGGVLFRPSEKPVCGLLPPVSIFYIVVVLLCW